MKRWEYDISSHSVEQVQAARDKLGLPAEQVEPVMFCDSEGVCFFDKMPNANTQAIVHILNSRGAEGWRLASVAFRTDQMICFWMRKVEEKA